MLRSGGLLKPMILLLSLLGLAAAECVVEAVDAKVRQRPAGWSREDSWRIRVETGLPGCRRFHLRTAPGMEITEVRAVIRQWDDTRTRLGRERLVALPAGRTVQTHILELPELRNGDRLELSVTREGHDPAPLELSGQWWTDPAAGPVVAVEEQPQEPAPVEQTIQIVLSGEEERDGASAAAGVRRMRGPQVLEVRGEGMVLAGLGPGMDTSVAGRLRFKLTEGEAVASWRVVRHEGHSVLASRADVLSQIAAGALAASIPEPGIGLQFKGREADWVVVDEVLVHIRRQVVEGRLTTVHPLKPRGLQKARRSRWATPWEQALLLTRYLRQLKIDALPVPVRPVVDGVVEAAVPEGYTAAVVRVRIDGEQRWIDPACGVCAVGELRPGLWGGQALSADLEVLPARPGHSIWKLQGTTRGEVQSFTLKLTAPWSISLRRYLTRFPVPDRGGEILGWLAISQGQILDHEGIADLGGPVILRFQVPLSEAGSASAALKARQANP